MPCFPLGNEVVVITTGVRAAAIVNDRDLEAVCAVVGVESVAFTVIENAPVAVGTPPIWPVAAFRVRPAGNAPEPIDQVYGVVPPEADKVIE